MDDYILNYQFAAFASAKEMFRAGYITKEQFNEFIEYNDLHFCANY